MRNPGCLAQTDRLSVYIPNTGAAADDWCLVMTEASGECHCQTAGYSFKASGESAVPRHVDDCPRGETSCKLIVGVLSSP